MEVSANTNLLTSVFILVAFCFVTSFNVLILAYARSFIPSEMAGRGVTTINLVPGIGSSVLPIVTGLILSIASQLGARIVTGYNVLFSFIAVLLLAGSAVYLRVPVEPTRGTA